MKPFENDFESQQIAGLTIENNFHEINVFGDLLILKDKASIGRLNGLIEALSEIRDVISQMENIPETAEVETSISIELVDNPFA